MANQKIDVVFVLGTGSHWRNNELRFSLRAIEKNLKGIRKIWIVGEKPSFIKNVNHIAHPDELGPNNADGNIIRKILRICQEETLTTDFLFINDDHLIMSPVEALDIPPYQKGDLSTLPAEYFEENFWRLRLYRTKKVLKAQGYSALHFDCHVPIVLNKKRFPEVMSQFDYETPTGYTMKSLYGNVVHPDGPALNGKKVVIFKKYVFKDIVERVKNREFVSFNDDGLNLFLKQWLIKEFPSPSRYEKTQPLDPFFELINWVISEDHDFKSGCELFDKYGKSRKAKKFFSKGETTAMYAKLVHKIKELLNYY